MIKVTFEDTESNLKAVAFLGIDPAPPSFRQAYEYLVVRLVHDKISVKTAKRTTDPILADMQWEYVYTCYRQRIRSHSTERAKKLRLDFWRQYKARVGKEGIPGNASYLDRRNFNRALMRTPLPEIRVFTIPPPDSEG